MKLKFIKTTFLKLIRRPLLAGLLGRFADELAAKGLSAPGVELNDRDYYQAVSVLAKAQEGLPPNLFEAMHVIGEMASEDAQQRLERAIEQSPLAGTLQENSTRPEIALQTFLADPVLFSRKLNEVKLTQVSKFEYFTSKLPLDRRATFTAPDAATVARITRDLDEWFPHHNRGAEHTNIEVIEMDEEFWFVIRHGDTYARALVTAPNRQVDVRHDRPVKEDAVVLCPERDEIRIHAGTKGEIELYRAVLAARLFGDDRYFSERKAFTLVPLVEDGLDSVEPIPGIDRVVLRAVRWAFDNGHHRVMSHEADDVFAAVAEEDTEAKVIPAKARPVEAAFDFHFTGATKPRRVVVRPPNILKVGRHSDARLVHAFLAARRFKTTVNLPPPRGGITHVDGLV